VFRSVPHPSPRGPTATTAATRLLHVRKMTSSSATLHEPPPTPANQRIGQPDSTPPPAMPPAPASHPTRHTTKAPHKNYTFRTPRTFSSLFQYLSNHLVGGGVMREHPTVQTHNPYSFGRRGNIPRSNTQFLLLRSNRPLLPIPCSDGRGIYTLWLTVTAADVRARI
jgi:hypothetical protein